MSGEIEDFRTYIQRTFRNIKIENSSLLRVMLGLRKFVDHHVTRLLWPERRAFSGKHHFSHNNGRMETKVGCFLLVLSYQY